MRILPVNLKRHLTALGLGLLLAGMVSAQGVPADLLDRLQTAEGDEAERLAAEVRRQRAKSGSAAMDLLLRRGREAIREADYPLAIDHLTALTDHAPGFAEGYHARAEAYFRADLFGPAIDDLEITLALDPQHFDAIFGLAVMLQETGDLRRAAILYRRTLALHPNHKNATEALTRLRRDGIGREL